MKLPTRSKVSELLIYVPETGALIWRPRPVRMFSSESHWKRWNTSYANAEAGCVNSVGYRKLGLLGKAVSAHRIVWLLVYGKWPSKQIDHIDGNRDNNRLDNLRVVSSLGNMRNRKTNENVTSGFRGVYWNKRACKWRAHIKDERKNIHLGYFNSFDQAVSARVRAETALGFHENHGR